MAIRAGKLMLYPAGDVPMSMSVLFVGASLGGRTRLVPELARVRERGDPTVIWVAGVALQHTVDGLDVPLGIPFWRAP